MPRLYLSAAHKSSGKTTLSIGLCGAFVQRGLVVQPFKKGPDYIDPLWLTQASQRCACNLDFNTMGHDEIHRVFQQRRAGADVSLIEGNKGLHDGMSMDGSDSNAGMAKHLKSPVILVIDTRGVSRGVAPLLLGYQQFDPEVNIAGVIFNMAGGERHAAKLRRVAETYTDIPVLGVVNRHKDLELTERHLGLMPSNENQQSASIIKAVTQQVVDQVNLEACLVLAKQGEALPLYPPLPVPDLPNNTVRIGICEDCAFSFYYLSDLHALQLAGAELVSINTLEDAELSNIDGLFIGGGFPETHMQGLSQNRRLRESIRQAIEAGLPTYAECGGLMYLAQRLIWNDQSAEMVGVIPSVVTMHEKPQGRGYVKLKETDAMLWPGEAETSVIGAHEFHYSRLENLDELRRQGRFAYTVKRGKGITGDEDGWVYKNLLASYSHLRDTDQHHWARRFVEFVKQYKRYAHV
ncbi:MAG: cobyrinate a,c-diamide synthase [Leucothrix sp.]